MFVGRSWGGAHCVGLLLLLQADRPGDSKNKSENWKNNRLLLDITIGYSFYNQSTPLQCHCADLRGTPPTLATSALLGLLVVCQSTQRHMCWPTSGCLCYAVPRVSLQSGPFVLSDVTDCSIYWSRTKSLLLFCYCECLSPVFQPCLATGEASRYQSVTQSLLCLWYMLSLSLADNSHSPSYTLNI